MPPYQGGGDMILSVTFEKTNYNHLPYKFEAGTPNIAGGDRPRRRDRLRRRRRPGRHRRPRARRSSTTRTAALARSRGCALIGTAREKAGVLSFVLEGVHPHDIGTILDQRGHRDPHRPPLRPAGHGPLRRPGHGARVARRSTTRTASSTPSPQGLAEGGGGVPAMNELGDLYQEIILDHYKKPRNCGAPRAAELQRRAATTRSAATSSRSRSSSKGDLVEDLRWQGAGCAISTASASLMSEAVKGKSRAEVRRALREVPRHGHRHGPPPTASASSRSSRACASSPSGSNALRSPGTP